MQIHFLSTLYSKMTRSSAHRGPWHADEDQNLLDLVQKQGPNNWVRISQHMQHRTPKQCRERYHQNLKQSLNHDPITHQEGEIIEQLVTEMGRRWAEIARRLGNRSDNAVKNWWNGSMNRRKRNGNQRQSGFKNMGHRAQPIPATRPSRPAFIQPPPHIEYHQQLQQGPSGWSDTHQQRPNLVNQSVSWTCSSAVIKTNLVPDTLFRAARAWSASNVYSSPARSTS